MSTRRFILSFVLVLTFSFTSALAQDYPNRPITQVVQFSAGTTTDIIARRLADDVSKILGQPLVCVNKTGGGGSVGSPRSPGPSPTGTPSAA